MTPRISSAPPRSSPAVEDRGTPMSMSSASLPPPHATHAVLNQPPEPPLHNLCTSDRVLVEGLRREGAGWAEDHVAGYGARMGTAEARQWADAANRSTPVLRTYDRYAHRIDQAE